MEVLCCNLMRSQAALSIGLVWVRQALLTQCATFRVPPNRYRSYPQILPPQPLVLEHPTLPRASLTKAKSEKTPDRRALTVGYLPQDTDYGAPDLYRNYLQIPRVLDTLRPNSDVFGETLFITIHQVYELWFREMIVELRQLQAALEHDDPAIVKAALVMLNAIGRHLVHEWEVMDALPRANFEKFRPFLGTGSGLQSTQFREIEILMGTREQGRYKRHVDGPAVQNRLLELCDKPTVYNSFLTFVRGRGYNIAEDSVVEGLCHAIRSDSNVAELARLLNDFDKSFLRWRERHMETVTRMIGDKQGTGGTPGVGYLLPRIKLFMPHLDEALHPSSNRFLPRNFFCTIL